VRLRITRQLSGSIDGIHLDDFVVGFVYDVGTSVGSYLLAEGAGEPVAEGAAEPVGRNSPAAFPAGNRSRFRFDVFTSDDIEATDRNKNKVVPIRRSQALSWAADSEGGRKRKRRKPTSDNG
jgi:hypothetical protein